MSADFAIKQYDTLPNLSLILKVGGVATSLATANTVKLVMAKRTAPNIPVVVGVMTVTDAAAGKVVYPWVVPNTDVAGDMIAEVHVVYNDGLKRKFPTVGYFNIDIIGALPEVAP